jgi:iron(III) transport system substrate-binding protein
VTRSSKHRTVWFMALVAAIVVTASAAAAPAPKTKPGLSIAPSGPTVTALAAASKKEDGLIIYGNPPTARWGPVISAFNKLYPWIKVTPYDEGDATAFSKYAAESNSGVRSADLIVASAPNLWVYATRSKVALDFTPYGLSKYPSFAKQYKGIFVMSPDPAITIYNKLILKDPSQVPTGLDDLAKKTAADPSTYKSIGYIIQNQFGYAAYWGYVAQQGWANLRILGPATQTTESAATMVQTVAQGGASVSPLTSGLVRGPIAGDPTLSKILGWTYEHDTTPLVPRGIAVTQKAHSPASAKLFLDFVFSQAGQQALCTAGFTAYMNGFRPKGCDNSLQALYDAVGKAHVSFVPFSQKFVNAYPAFAKTWHTIYTH